MDVKSDLQFARDVKKRFANTDSRLAKYFTARAEYNERLISHAQHVRALRIESDKRREQMDKELKKSEIEKEEAIKDNVRATNQLNVVDNMIKMCGEEFLSKMLYSNLTPIEYAIAKDKRNRCLKLLKS